MLSGYSVAQNGDSVNNTASGSNNSTQINWTQRSPTSARKKTGFVSASDIDKQQKLPQDVIFNGGDSPGQAANLVTESVTVVQSSTVVWSSQSPTPPSGQVQRDSQSDLVDGQMGDSNEVSWTVRSSDSDNSGGEEGTDGNKENVDKKKAKKLRFKEEPFLDLENHEALRMFILDSTDPYQSALDLIGLTHTQKLDNQRLEMVLDVVNPCLREKIPNLNTEVPVSKQLKALEHYIQNRIITFHLFDSTFAVSQIEEKQLVGEFLVDQIKQCNQCYQADKLLSMFAECKVDNADSILTALLLIFFKFEGSARTLEYYSTICEKAVFHSFIRKLDHLLMNREECIAFVDKHDLNVNKMKNSRDIKKFLNRMFKNVQTTYDDCHRPIHEYYEFTPNFLEISNWDTLLYLLKVRFKQFKNSMSDEAWLELSQLLVIQSPGIKNRLLNTLRNIDPEEELHWLDRFNNMKEYEKQHQTSNRNYIVHQNTPQANNWSYNQHQNNRYYQGRYNAKLTIQFVDSEKEFEFMLDYLQHETVIGLDGEWLPIFSYQPTRISILQIATSSHCFILDLLNFHSKSPQYREYWRRFVIEVMENGHITKIGFGIHHDLDNIKSATGQKPIRMNNSVDLSNYSSQMIQYFAEFDLYPITRQRQTGIKKQFIYIVNRAREREHRQQGLSLATYIFFGKELDKSEQMSNWNRRPLRHAQMLYSALDAFCLVDMYEMLLQLNTEVFKFETLQTFFYVVKQIPQLNDSQGSGSGVGGGGGNGGGGPGGSSGGGRGGRSNSNRKNKRKNKQPVEITPELFINPFE